MIVGVAGAPRRQRIVAAVPPVAGTPSTPTVVRLYQKVHTIGSRTFGTAFWGKPAVS